MNVEVLDRDERGIDTGWIYFMDDSRMKYYVDDEGIATLVSGNFGGNTVSHVNAARTFMGWDQRKVRIDGFEIPPRV